MQGISNTTEQNIRVWKIQHSIRF